MIRRAVFLLYARYDFSLSRSGLSLGLLFFCNLLHSAEATIAVAANFRETAQEIAQRLESTSVSYTHLTLPTIYSV